MKFIKNTGRYAVAFTIQKNNRSVKLELDRKRVYMDTGNIATNGITPVEEKDIEELKKQKLFNKMLESGDLTILEEKDVKSPEDNKIKELEKINKELEKKVKKLEQNPTAEDKKAMDDLRNENATLKAQLESLTKAKTEENPDTKADEAKETPDVTDGF